MCSPLVDLDTDLLHRDSIALFLDFDGTLVEIASHPDAVALDETTGRNLTILRDVLGGALALVSGRSIEDIDRKLAPEKFAVAGMHGLERRDSLGRIQAASVDPGKFDHILASIEAAIADRPGLLLEKKPASAALHFRARPELADFCHRTIKAIAADCPGVSVVTGKMVIEAKLGNRTKADAVTEFMNDPPFAGRLPIYAGDDATDEDAFAAIGRLGGISIKVGTEASIAHYRAASTAQFLDWLHARTIQLSQSPGQPPDRSARIL